jgi:cobalt-zinc-cadmium efflux system outer membrane protein
MDTNSSLLENRRTRRRVLAALLALSLYQTACAAPLTPIPSPRPLGRDLGTALPVVADRKPASERFQELEGSLTLPLALAAALENSPRLESFGWRVRADEARALQAGLLPNPVLVVEGENFAGSGNFRAYDAAETTVFLGQLVELGAKRAKRRRVAMLERELSGWDYEATRLDVLTETTQRFVAALTGTRRLDIANEILRISSESLRATRARVRAGAASSVEVARSEVSLATIEVERDRRRVELEAARRELASSWGGTPKFSSLEGNLADLRDLPSLERISEALSENPDLARWATEISKREAAMELARAGAIPDVTAGLGLRYLQESDDAALVFGVEIPLPLFDRNQGARSAAQAETNRARALAREARLSVTRALVSAHAVALGAYGNARSLELRVLPQAQAVYEGTQDGYRKGLFRLVDVLDAQRTLFGARTEYVSALARYHIARAELERLTGSSLEFLHDGSN